jgi:hypothetical protein
MLIIRAWQHISSEVLVKGFLKYCISNGTEGTDDDMLWNVNVDHKSMAAHLIRSACEGLLEVLYIQWNRRD